MISGSGIHKQPDVKKHDNLLQRASAETRLEVTHYQFKEWPDHSVPESAGELLTFLNKIMAHENGDPDNDVVEGPILVHCRLVITFIARK